MLHKRSCSVKVAEEPCYVGKFNYHYQEIHNLHDCQEKTCWTLKIDNVVSNISKLIKRYLNFVNEKQRRNSRKILGSGDFIQSDRSLSTSFKYPNELSILLLQLPNK